MKSKLIFTIVITILLFSCSRNSECTIIISNNTSDSISQVIEIPVSEIKRKIQLGETDHILVKNENNEQIPSQITYDGYLLTCVDILPSSEIKLKIEKGESQEYEPFVYARQFPEHKNDFGWENDRVGFRFYEKSLAEVQAATNGLDIWLKRTSRLVLDDWYRKDASGEASYHVDHGEGCDPYAVGTTLGAGAMAPYVDNQIVRNKNYESVEILDCGPLRMTAKLIYPLLEVNDQKVEDIRTVSLDAGSQYTKIVQSYGNAHFSVVSGIVKRTGDDTIIEATDKTYLIYSEPEDATNGEIYIGMLYPDSFVHAEISRYEIDKNEFTHHVAVSKYEGKPITYYTGFGWNKFGFKDVSDFEVYTQKYIQHLQDPLDIKIN